ncbi:unnamed protein product [Sphenostylis stenocarpa]|uniref:Uncharacterized protein n=1 Tax=Sphenostylis stenocarpa TaxID=92480 RepID=A0AA86SSH3_9FABA|nr:unnamed protein product [Sphenostylis stenocarpa]
MRSLSRVYILRHEKANEKVRECGSASANIATLYERRGEEKSDVTPKLIAEIELQTLNYGRPDLENYHDVIFLFDAHVQ